MATYRQVLQHPETKKWAYIEYNGSYTHVTILGDQEFDTKEEAVEWSEGFEPFSYVHEDPKELKERKLKEEKERITTRLKEIDQELQ